MEIRRYLARSFSSVFATACSMALLGCGGTGNPGIFQAGPEDSGSSGSTNPDASLLPQDAGSLLADAYEPPCPPAPVTSFAPAWKPPSASKSGACSSIQISGYFDACLGPSSDSAGCAAFVQANGHCASCLQSNDTDPHYGPVVWHANQTYYTTNIAGCIADVQADLAATGCGAAYQAVVQCKEAACSACLTAQTPDFSRYSACENKAGSECQTFIQVLTTTCGTALKDPTSAISVCIPPSGDTAQNAYLRLAPVFCGQ